LASPIVDRCSMVRMLLYGCAGRLPAIFASQKGWCPARAGPQNFAKEGAAGNCSFPRNEDGSIRRGRKSHVPPRSFLFVLYGESLTGNIRGRTKLTF
jgi:hypothetical protein